MNCYLVEVDEAFDYGLHEMGHSYKRNVFMTESEAKTYFDKAVNEKLAQGNYDEDVLAEMKAESTSRFYADYGSAWVIRIYEAVMGE